MTKRLANLIWMIFAVTACRGRSTSEHKAWEQPQGQKFGIHVMRLRSGLCLDERKLMSPWVLHSAQAPNADFTMTASPLAIGVRPVDYDVVAGRAPIVISVDYGWWTTPPAGQGYWAVATPTRIQQNIASGLFRPQKKLPTSNKVGWFTGIGKEQIFVDREGLRQCLIDDGEIRCTAVAAYRDWHFGFRIDSHQEGQVVELLDTIEETVEKTRAVCPAKSRS